MIKKVVLFSLISVSLLIGCSDDSDTTSSQTSTTVWEQKSQMLTNWVDNFIIPNYNNLSEKLSEIETLSTAFTSNPNQQSLELVRSAWIEAYKSWQYVEMFNVGPAEQSFYNLKMNIYPTTTEKIEALIASGEYASLDNSPYNSAQGFPALDYLLYGVASDDSSIIALYSSSPNYGSYLTEIINRMISNTNYVITEWDSYRERFISSVENTATSSANKMANDFIYYYEKGFRTNKIGIPIGVFSNGSQFPEKVEAYYNQNISGILALEAINAIKTFFDGNGSYSLKQFIDNFATDELANLSSDISAQFSLVQSNIEALDSNFANQINNGLNQINVTYDNIQTGTVMLKTDMLTVLQIATDYVDADGD